ncbi:DUF4269 domain-containing protein [Bacillus suaedaesalsae]|uniref:DUF4269 domain-containing protein n=1 Tax=Bacillus suaedaesalsae TaxID=2810349 RepID=A0ABS2DJY9_9BACI|nr:DUF4269 domain-containing protein [Bacillus suaedaesalsae]MBM6618706.1 DUF4269 domain-containing protein [Bacillus suaedaesalsae]
MFENIEYLNSGTSKQKKAYHVIQLLGIMDELAIYTPVLCGTIPLGIDLPQSDLDIIMYVKDFPLFERKLLDQFSHHEKFRLKSTIMRNEKVIKANFYYQGFEFELFGQNKPVHEQYAYLHMVIEHNLLVKNPKWKEKVIQLKKQGYKTEPAFCTLLNVSGDPYDQLIEYGVLQGFI